MNGIAGAMTQNLLQSSDESGEGDEARWCQSIRCSQKTKHKMRYA